MKLKLGKWEIELRRETTQERLERVIAERNSDENERLRREWLKPFERLWDNPEDERKERAEMEFREKWGIETKKPSKVKK